MGKKAALFVCILLPLFTTGCWNYRSLNDLAIVSGITVDRDKDTMEYKLGYEVIDLTKDVKTGGLNAILIDSRGKTLFDAARNAKKRLDKKLYFGNTELVIVSEDIAKSGHMMHIIDWILRDAELRETTHIVVAQTPAASDLLRIEGINNAIVAFEINSIVSDDHTVTSSTSNPMLYQAFNMLHGSGKALTLPAFHMVINDEEPAAEANGCAVFKKETLVGYLTPEETKYFLFVTGQVDGGILTISTKGNDDRDISFEISTSKTNSSFSVDGGQLVVKVDVDVGVYLAEAGAPVDALDEEEITSLEAMAGAAVKERIERVLAKVQSEYRTDIFGFGSMIHQRNPALWKQVADTWDDGYFPMLSVLVNAKVNIINTAYLKKSTKEDE